MNNDNNVFTFQRWKRFTYLFFFLSFITGIDVQDCMNDTIPPTPVLRSTPVSVIGFNRNCLLELKADFFDINSSD